MASRITTLGEPVRRAKHREHRGRHLGKQPGADEMKPSHADDIAAPQFGEEIVEVHRASCFYLRAAQLDRKILG